MSSKPLVLDGHLHVWPSPSQHTYATGKVPPDSLADSSDTESLLTLCARAGVHGALIVQPINLLFDHSYVLSAIMKYPGRFVGCALANPGGGGVDELEQLLSLPLTPFKAVRFNPSLWPEHEKMTNELGKQMFALCGEKDAVVGFMCFHGLHLHIEDIKELCAMYPKTRVLIDHFGFCKGVDDPNWAALLALAEYPQVAVKASAQFRVVPSSSSSSSSSSSDGEWPYPAAGLQLRQLVDRYGAARVVWGSDFPFVSDQCGYGKAATVVECGAGLDEREVQAVMGGSLAAMFPGSWY